MAAVTAREKVLKFMADYNSNVSKIKNRISEGSQRLEVIQLEVNYLQQKEIPEAIERRVLTDDKTEETKLRKALEKLQNEQQELKEEAVVLESVLKKVLIKAADEVSGLQSLFQEEKREVESVQYGKMMKAKAAYMETIQKESKALHEMNNVDIKLQ